MAVYNLNETYYLWEDIQEVIDRIGLLYTFELDNDKRIYKSKTRVPNGAFWASIETNQVFNKLIPKVKSLHKDMYSLIEAIYKYNNNGIFDRIDLLEKYSLFDEFRLLNNQFKHFTTGSTEIDVIQLALLERTEQFIDVMCQFKSTDGTIRAHRYSDFIDTFLIFLEDHGLISFNS